MPDTSTDAAKSAHADGSTTPKPIPRRWNSSRAIQLATLALVVVAVAVAVAAWLRAGHEGPRFTDSQTAQAKTNICAAYATVRQGVIANTQMTSPNPDDPTGRLAVAANARLALLGGATYLRDRLAAQPATPDDLAKAVTSMSTTIAQLGVNYLAGADDTAQDPLRMDVDGQLNQINDLCK